MRTHAGVYRGGPRDGQPTPYCFDLYWVERWAHYVTIPDRGDD